MALTQAENAVDTRPKNFLTQPEITRFLKAARKGSPKYWDDILAGAPVVTF